MQAAKGMTRFPADIFAEALAEAIERVVLHTIKNKHVGIVNTILSAFVSELRAELILHLEEETDIF